MPFLMVRNDITKMRVDAVVNPANEMLFEGSGTSRAIFRAAGEKKLADACARIKHCDLGEAAATDAFDLDAKYIIHAVCPEYHVGSANEDQYLYRAYIASMNLAEGLGCDSIAFPLMSSGSCGYPKDTAMQIAMVAIDEFLAGSDMMVYMVIFDRASVEVNGAYASDLVRYIDDNYVDSADEILTHGNVRKMSPPGLTDDLDQTFSEMLLRLIDRKRLRDPDVYKRANIDRKHFSKIRNNRNYVPGKKTVISFAIALELSLDETVDLLKRAGYALSDSSGFDVIVRFFIENRIYDIMAVNEALFSYGEPLLGE